jgi:hypothetical protein
MACLRCSPLFSFRNPFLVFVLGVEGRARDGGHFLYSQEHVRIFFLVSSDLVRFELVW